MALFESYERRIDKINGVLAEYGISSIEEAEKITKDAGLNVYDQIKGIQPICFENACWAYTVGAAIAIKKGCKRAADAAAAIVTLVKCFWKKRQSVSVSLQDMSPLPQQKVLSVSLRRQTKFVRNRFALF